jgi:hypothetical protein
VSSKIPDGNGVKNMPSSILAPNSDSLLKQYEKYRQPNGAQQKIFRKIKEIL